MARYKRFSHKKKFLDNNVGQQDVGHTIKKSTRFVDENYNKIMEKVEYINKLSDTMQTDFSKTLNNILSDYFLDEEIEKHKYELDGL